jgi:hypothetical protein
VLQNFLGPGYWVLGTGYWVLGTGYWVRNPALPNCGRVCVQSYRIALRKLDYWEILAASSGAAIWQGRAIGEILAGPSGAAIWQRWTIGEILAAPSGAAIWQRWTIGEILAAPSGAALWQRWTIGEILDCAIVDKTRLDQHIISLVEGAALVKGFSGEKRQNLEKQENSPPRDYWGHSTSAGVVPGLSLGKYRWGVAGKNMGGTSGGPRVFPRQDPRQVLCYAAGLPRSSRFAKNCVQRWRSGCAQAALRLRSGCARLAHLPSFPGPC